MGGVAAQMNIKVRARSLTDPPPPVFLDRNILSYLIKQAP